MGMWHALRKQFSKKSLKGRELLTELGIVVVIFL